MGRGKTLCFENPGFNSLSDFSLCEIEGGIEIGEFGELGRTHNKS